MALITAPSNVLSVVTVQHWLLWTITDSPADGLDKSSIESLLHIPDCEKEVFQQTEYINTATFIT